MQRIIMIALLLACTGVLAQQLPPASNINGRIQSLAASANALMNDCSARTGELMEALDKAQQEIAKLKAEKAKPTEITK